MAAKPPAPAAPDAAPAKPKSKKLLLIILAAVVAVVLVGVAILVALMMFQPAAEELDADGQPVVQLAAPAAPPTFMPLENMVVNLADPGAMRFAQIGISVQLADSATADRLTAFMPAIRNGMLRLASQRTAAELLTPAGKDALAADMLGMIRQTIGLPDQGTTPSPVQAVLFTSLIVQ
ncbi:flagellar basal body-associated FliL family protein [Serpentinimonas barnesii]|uniref:flagellar basal body-associated FliL family protein n=1 Tax=Serpentinimonas barnesii TaxID=1458427 RepID=UPI000694B647|nr:flagellar basal body-associated FliL family protein [Serpentinimonas barnesii]